MRRDFALGVHPFCTLGRTATSGTHPAFQADDRKGQARNFPPRAILFQDSISLLVCSFVTGQCVSP